MQRHAPVGKSVGSSLIARSAGASALAVAFGLALSGKHPGAAQEPPPLADPARLATAIARTMNLTRPSASEAPILQRFTSHDNVVESLTISRNAKDFANLTAHRDNIQAQTTRYMCKADRRVYIKKGVVFNEVFTGPAPSTSFSFVIDEKACASLIEPAIADPAALRTLVDATAGRLDAALAQKSTFAGSHFRNLTVKGDTIEVVNRIDALAFADFFKARDFEVRGKVQGLFCSLLGDAIRRGVKIRMVYAIEDGPPVLAFPIDASVC